MKLLLRILTCNQKEFVNKYEDLITITIWFLFPINSIKVKWAGHGASGMKEIQNFGITFEKRKPTGYQCADSRRIRIWTFQK